MQLRNSCHKHLVRSVNVFLQTPGTIRNGVTTCQSSAGVSTRSWRQARGPSGFGTSTSCTWSSCGRWLKPCPSSSGRPSSCTPAERQRTGGTNSCCWRSCTWPSGSARTEPRTTSCVSGVFELFHYWTLLCLCHPDPSRCTLTRRLCLLATSSKPLDWRSGNHWRFLKACSVSYIFAPAVDVTPGGPQTGLPQHLQDHGLCGLLQVSAVGETAGEQRRWKRWFSEFGFQAAVSVLQRVGFCFDLHLSHHQTQGLGTSLKILFSQRQIEALPGSGGLQRPRFHFSRQEIVSLLNAFGRWDGLQALHHHFVPLVYNYFILWE